MENKKHRERESGEKSEMQRIKRNGNHNAKDRIICVNKTRLLFIWRRKFSYELWILNNNCSDENIPMCCWPREYHPMCVSYAFFFTMCLIFDSSYCYSGPCDVCKFIYFWFTLNGTFNAHTHNRKEPKKTHRPYEFLYKHFNNRNNSLYFRSRPCDIRHKTQHVYIFRSKRHICDDAHNTFRTPKNRSHTLSRARSGAGKKRSVI